MDDENTKSVTIMDDDVPETDSGSAEYDEPMDDDVAYEDESYGALADDIDSMAPDDIPDTFDDDSAAPPDSQDEDDEYANSLNAKSLEKPRQLSDDESQANLLGMVADSSNDALRDEPPSHSGFAVAGKAPSGFSVMHNRAVRSNEILEANQDGATRHLSSEEIHRQLDISDEDAQQIDALSQTEASVPSSDTGRSPHEEVNSFIDRKIDEGHPSVAAQVVASSESDVQKESPVSASPPPKQVVETESAPQEQVVETKPAPQEPLVDAQTQVTVNSKPVSPPANSNVSVGSPAAVATEAPPKYVNIAKSRPMEIKQGEFVQVAQAPVIRKNKDADVKYKVDQQVKNVLESADTVNKEIMQSVAEVKRLQLIVADMSANVQQMLMTAKREYSNITNVNMQLEQQLIKSNNLFSDRYLDNIQKACERNLSSYIEQSRDNYMELFKLAVRDYRSFSNAAMKFQRMMEDKISNEFRMIVNIIYLLPFLLLINIALCSFLIFKLIFS